MTRDSPADQNGFKNAAHQVASFNVWRQMFLHVPDGVRSAEVDSRWIWPGNVFLAQEKKKKPHLLCWNITNYSVVWITGVSVGLSVPKLESCTSRCLFLPLTINPPSPLSPCHSHTQTHLTLEEFMLTLWETQMWFQRTGWGERWLLETSQQGQRLSSVPGNTPRREQTLAGQRGEGG